MEVLLSVKLLELVALGADIDEVAPTDPESNDTLEEDGFGRSVDSLTVARVLERIVMDPLRLPLVIVEGTATLVNVKSLDGTTLVVKSLR